jgi:hypothetical protein
MKSATLTTTLLLGLALMSNGCASLVPPTPQQEVNHEQLAENVADRNTDEDCFGWTLLYWTLYCAGESLAKQ